MLVLGPLRTGRPRLAGPRAETKVPPVGKEASIKEGLVANMGCPLGVVENTMSELGAAKELLAFKGYKV